MSFQSLESFRSLRSFSGNYIKLFTYPPSTVIACPVR